MNIAIVGAGTTGLFLNRMLSRRKDCRITVFEKAEKVGMKLKASGGGKANLLNTDIRPEHYNRPDFMEHILQQADADRVRRTWESFGLLTRTDEEGRVYPLSLFSQTALDTLLDGLGANTDIRCGYEVKHILPEKGKWRINGEDTLFDKVVLCSGSPAGMISRNRKDYNAYLQDMQLKTSPLFPSLVGFRIRNYPKRLEGCRARAEVRLMQQGKELFLEAGEITFKEDGISGIVILNASALYNRLSSREGCFLLMDFLSTEKDWDLRQHLQKYRSLCGVLHPKLNELYRRQAFDPRAFRMDIEGTYELDFAQVCHGGISLDEVDAQLALRKYPGLFAGGEMLDIDGVCGGYNLFFACACACIIYDNL